ncbi:MAG: maleylpyruvate isomerase family mycothiol-dependent enzyme [Candidatus Nanopelagicales bacterium]|nr:maleylpyruvate isomerase family mycothiol-dependent enzyme [Candidatus Nanopelagicales bacterium]MCF8551059.1 maleylpyruvate isomerase family mycothiol-dependent enzyme [Candidatus Nanopelagicales bacterium]
MTTDLRSIHSDRDPVSTYQEAMQDVIDLLSSVETSQWSMPTSCPGWSIADIAAHLIDLDVMVAGTERISHEPNWETLPHVTNPSQQFTERGVDYRRGTPPEQLLGDLSSASTTLVATTAAGGSPSIKIPWVKDEISLDQFYSMRTFDTWTHEQDIRLALGLPGHLGSNPARMSAQRMISSLPLIWGKKVGAPPGAALTLTLTGPDIEGTAHVVVGEDGRAAFVDQTGEGAAQVSMPWPAFVHAFAGRVPPEQSLAAATYSGEFAANFISQLPSTP